MFTILIWIQGISQWFNRVIPRLPFSHNSLPLGASVVSKSVFWPFKNVTLCLLIEIQPSYIMKSVDALGHKISYDFSSSFSISLSLFLSLNVFAITLATDCINLWHNLFFLMLVWKVHLILNCFLLWERLFLAGNCFVFLVYKNKRLLHFKKNWNFNGFLVILMIFDNIL